MPFSQSLPSRLSRNLSYLAGEEWAVLLLVLAAQNLSQHQHQNWRRHGETWDSLVAALLETKISIRAGIRGHYERVTFGTGRPSNQPSIRPAVQPRSPALRYGPDRSMTMQRLGVERGIEPLPLVDLVWD